ncbi:MAG: type I secretion C-terminal target domain-containing protein [Cyanobacteria bacterium CRU_2_1]|nr:type I secretion C-terminal target domain-containing protein [Cyanobacteria bacterium CRU_2_1]
MGRSHHYHLTVPPPSQGTLFLNNPQTGGTPVSPGQVIPPTQISQLFFQTAPGFTGGTFTYTATDDLGAESLTPGTVSLNLSTTSNIPPSVASPTNQIPPGATVNLTGISGTDPDGTIASFTILTTPSPGQGALFLGNPAAGGTPVSPGQAITPAQVNQLFFRPTPNFTGGTFTYTATDNLGATDPTPGTVNLTLPGVTPPGGDDGGGVTPTPGSNLLPTAENLTVDTTPDLANQLPPLFAIDPDGSIGEIILLTLPTPDQGILYLGSPFAGGTPIALGQELTPAEASQLYFQATSEFTGGSFTYYAIDNLGGDSNTATVRLNSATGVNPLNPEARCRPGRTIRGQNRPNNLRGTSDRDTILGRSKNDSLRGLDCADMLDGAQGDDRAFGGNAADMVRGRSGHDRLNGDDGDDRMEGGTGRDQISGDRGNDTGMGNGGNDDLRGKGGNDNMIGNKGNDRMFGGVGKDALSGRQDRDFIRGGAGDDIIRGGLGFDNLSGDQKADIVDGGGGNDMVRGGGGIDSLYGKRGNDRIFGGTQVDYISGNQGNDRIIGGGGADIITGGLGSDHFVYRNVGQGGDIIREFRVRRDKIDVRSIFSRPEYGRSNEFRRYLRRVQLGSDTVIRIDANGDRAGGFQDFITLLNVNANRLTVRDFIL